MKINNEKLVWYILDEIVVKCSATHGRRDCMICDKAIEAMRLLEQPTSDECKLLYDRRRRK